jgi:hypothetical protein
MSIKNVLALAAALLTSSSLAANAQVLGARVLGAGLGLRGTVLQQPAVLNGAQFIGGNTLSLEQAAVINGGVTAEGLMTGGNLLGITRLPQGTQLVTGAPGNTAIILPGMVGLPSLSGCNVAVIGPIGPSALSLIGTSHFVASLPVGGVQTTTTTTHKYTRITRVVEHKAPHKRVLHKCVHKRIEILK